MRTTYFSYGRVISPSAGQPHATAPKNRIKSLQIEKGKKGPTEAKSSTDATTSVTLEWLKIRTDRPSSIASMNPGWRSLEKTDLISNLTGLAFDFELIKISLSSLSVIISLSSTTFQSDPTRITPGMTPRPSQTTLPPNWRNSERSGHRPSSFFVGSLQKARFFAPWGIREH